MPLQAAVAPAPAFAPTQAPGATLATLPASTHSAEAPAPSNIQPESTAASWQMQDPLQEVRTRLSLQFMMISGPQCLPYRLARVTRQEPADHY